MENVEEDDWMDVRIARSAARGVWAAMHDDDDLAEDYVNICVVHGLNHLVEDVGAEPYTADEWRRIVSNLRQARKTAQAGEEEMIKRWNMYNEPPF